MENSDFELTDPHADQYPENLSYLNPKNNSFDAIIQCYQQRISKQVMLETKEFYKIHQSPKIQLISNYKTLEEAAYAIIMKRQRAQFHKFTQEYFKSKREQYLIDIFDPKQKFLILSIVTKKKLCYYFNNLQLYPIGKCSESGLTNCKFKQQLIQSLKNTKKCNKVLTIGRDIQQKMISIKTQSISRRHLQLQYTPQYIISQKQLQIFFLSWCSTRRSNPLNRLTKQIFYKIAQFLTPQCIFQVEDTKSTFGTEILIKQPQQIETNYEYYVDEEKCLIQFDTAQKGKKLQVLNMQQYQSSSQFLPYLFQHQVIIDIQDDEAISSNTQESHRQLSILINQQRKIHIRQDDPPIGIIYSQHGKKLHTKDLKNCLIDFIIYFQKDKWMIKPMNYCKIWKKLYPEQKYYIKNQTTLRLSKGTQLTIYHAKSKWLFNQ